MDSDDPIAVGDDEEMRVLLEERALYDDLEEAVECGADRFVSLKLSPDLHRQLLNFAFEKGLHQLLSGEGRVHGISLEGATVALIVKRYLEGHHPELGAAG